MGRKKKTADAKVKALKNAFSLSLLPNFWCISQNMVFIMRKKSTTWGV